MSRHPLADESKILPAIRDKLAPGEPEAFTNRSPERLVGDKVRKWGMSKPAQTVAAASPDGSAIAVGLTVDRDTAERKAGAYLYICSPDGKERKLVWSEVSDLD